MSDIKNKLVTMLQLQGEMNRWVHEDWSNQGFEWYRAIWIEAGEMLEHYGWKWWKHQEPDFPQVKLEVIDIVHFMLSQELESGQTLGKIADRIADDFSELDVSMALRRIGGIELRPRSAATSATASARYGFDLLRTAFPMMRPGGGPPPSGRTAMRAAWR